MIIVIIYLKVALGVAFLSMLLLLMSVNSGPLPMSKEDSEDEVYQFVMRNMWIIPILSGLFWPFFIHSLLSEDSE